jgi:N-carbamoylputrescine amidase
MNKFRNKKIDIVILQYSVSDNINKNLAGLIKNINDIKVTKNTTIVISHELSYLKYFPITKNIENKKNAINMSSKIIKDILYICAKKNIFFLFSFFEKSNGKFYNSSILISPDGVILDKYRKRNIPNEKCYEEGYYFNESKNKHAVIDIGECKIGLMTCWDQWHSESYQQMNKLGADIILCPTSIGSPYYKGEYIGLNKEKEKWINVIAANSLMINTPIVIANRSGKEKDKDNMINFWGSSFVTDANGDIIFMNKSKRSTNHITVNLAQKKISKKSWSFCPK